MRVLSQMAAFLVLTLVASSSMVAQDPPNLTGTWVMVPDKSSFGAMPAPQSRTDVIDHKSPALTIKRHQVSGMGDITSTLVYGIDGKPYDNKVGEMATTSKLKWDGQVLVIETTLSTPQGEATLNSRFSLSADKKTLTEARTINIQGQDIAQTIVLVKQ